MAASSELNLQDKVDIIGPPCCSVYTTKDQDNLPSQPFRTLLIQETMKRGIIMPSSVVSYAHTDKDIAETVEKIHEALVIYKKALGEGIDKYLEGRSIQPVWRRYNTPQPESLLRSA
jgi:glutamate-1-semialdehyde 2,1-aminomutase